MFSARQHHTHSPVAQVALLTTTMLAWLTSGWMTGVTSFTELVQVALVPGQTDRMLAPRVCLPASCLLLVVCILFCCYHFHVDVVCSTLLRCDKKLKFKLQNVSQNNKLLSAAKFIMDSFSEVW